MVKTPRARPATKVEPRPDQALRRIEDDVTTPPHRLAGLRREFDDLDVSLYEAIADTHSPALDWAMPRLTGLADHSKLWIGIAALLAATGSERARRAAARGLTTLAVTSLIANQVAKRLNRRPRPSLARVPLARIAGRIPRSTSFPSGHAASAAAFAGAAAMETPALRVPLTTLAGLVGFSRVATGAHYPSDVAAGFLLGAGVAALGRRLVPPAAAAEPGRPRPASGRVDARRSGAGLTLVVNPASHSGRGAEVLRRVRRSLPELRVVELGDDDDVDAVMREAAADAEVLGVAGGDGTVAAAAAAAMAAGLPLAVFPAGTFNHFAKTLGIGRLDRAVRAVRRGTVTTVDVAYLNDRLFLNTASVGAYSDFVAARERLEKFIGKPLAACYAALRTMRSRTSLPLRIDGRTHRATLVFIGNCRYQPGGFAPAFRERLDDGLLDVRILDLPRGRGRLGVLAALATGRLAENRHYHQYTGAELTIELPSGPSRVTRDGELGEDCEELRLRAVRRALTVFCAARR